MSFYKMLETIQKRPGMHLSYPSILCLDSFLRGYFLAKLETNFELSREEIEFNDFQGWIQEKFRIESTQSWSQIIFFFSASEQNALDNFFELLEEFKNSRRDVNC